MTLGKARLETEVNRRIFTLLQAALPDGSDFYDDASGIDAEMLNAAITGVADAVQPDGVGEVPITIIGRHGVVDQISEFEGFAPAALEEIRNIGFLGRYKGCNVRRLHNWADENNRSYMPANELWVFAGTVGKFAAFGPLLTKTWSENNVDYTHYRARKDVGGLINHPEQARRLVDTAIEA